MLFGQMSRILLRNFGTRPIEIAVDDAIYISAFSRGEDMEVGIYTRRLRESQDQKQIGIYWECWAHASFT
jgi:hypothetical protein